MRYVAGLDGGGTKTAVTIADETGQAVYSFTAGPMNYNGQDEASIRRALQEICGMIAKVCGGLDACGSICIGAAGISNPAVGSRLKALLEENGYRGCLTLVGDHETALCGAHEGLYGIILIAGTGSICYGRSADGRTHRAGGFGYLIDDEGSGYSIGRDLLTALVRAEDGREAPTVITELVYRQLGFGTVQDIVGFVYDKNRNKKDIAALAPLLSEACDAGDALALRIAETNAQSLVEMAAAVTERLGMQEGALAVAGSVLQRNAYVRAAFEQKLLSRYPGMRCGEGKRDASYGAVLLALQALRR